MHDAELPARGIKIRTCLAHKHGLILFLDNLPGGKFLASAEDERGEVLWKIVVDDWQFAYETLVGFLDIELNLDRDE
jgi:hypothetical protein